MKRYTLIFLFTKDMKKVLLIRGNNKLFVGKLNGFGGKIEDGETIIDGAIRETIEETNIKIEKLKHILTVTYPENLDENKAGSELNVLYGIHDEVKVEDNREGTFDWYKVEYVMDYNNKEFAGYANIALFVREILIEEGKILFY